MKALLIIGILLMPSQDVFVPTVGQGVAQVKFNVGPNLMVNVTSAPIQLVGAVVDSFMLAEPDATKGQAAVDGCNATGMPPPLSKVGEPPTCENTRLPAIMADIAARARIAVKAIPNSVLQAQKLRVVQ